MFVVCGEALFDVFIPQGVEPSSLSLPFAARAGGSPFNVAIGLGRLGQDVALMGGISTDFLGDRLMSILEAEKVSQHMIVRKSAPTTLGFVQKDSSGSASYLFYGEGAADRLLQPTDIDLSKESVSGIHMGSFPIVVPPIADTLYGLARQQSGKCLLTLDPNVRLTVEPDIQQWRVRVENLVPLVDVIKISDEDIGFLYPDDEPERIIEGWMKAGVKLIVLTRGSKGASLWSQQAHAFMPARPVEVVDTVGAGDTFQAALVDSLLELKSISPDWEQELTRETLERIGRRAICAASITCFRAGADLPNRKEIEAQEALFLNS